jgi:hypothetical protein
MPTLRGLQVRSQSTYQISEEWCYAGGRFDFSVKINQLKLSYWEKLYWWWPQSSHNFHHQCYFSFTVAFNIYVFEAQLKIQHCYYITYKVKRYFDSLFYVTSRTDLLRQSIISNYYYYYYYYHHHHHHHHYHHQIVNRFNALVHNLYVHVLCTSYLLCSLCISLHPYFCLFTSSELCVSSPMLGIIMIFVLSFVNAHTILSHFLTLLLLLSSYLIDNFDFCCYYYFYHHHHYSEVINCLVFVLCVCLFLSLMLTL